MSETNAHEALMARRREERLRAGRLRYARRRAEERRRSRPPDSPEQRRNLERLRERWNARDA